MNYEPSNEVAALLRERRASTDRLLRDAAALDSRDRALLRGVYERGMSASEFARAVDRHPHTFRRRIRALVARVTSIEYQFVLRHRHEWPRTRRQVAEAIILRGRSQRAAARELGLSLHRVRQEIGFVRVLVQISRDTKHPHARAS